MGTSEQGQELYATPQILLPVVIDEQDQKKKRSYERGNDDDLYLSSCQLGLHLQSLT
jgi:hypothetical protein